MCEATHAAVAKAVKERAKFCFQAAKVAADQVKADFNRSMSRKGMAGAVHVSHKEEPYGSPLTSAAVALLRRRYNDDAIANLFSLPQTMAQGHGCIVGLVDVECTWHADLFNEIEQAQLAEQASASVARIKELEQELKAAKAVSSDAGGDKLIELLSELVASNKEINASLGKIEKKPACCSIA